MRAIRQERPIATRIYVFGLFYMFFVFGALENLKGPTLPLVMRDLGLDYTLGGTLMMASSLGFMAASFIAGLLTDRIGRRRVILLTCASLLAGILLYAFSASFLLLFLGMLLLGFGLGSIELCGNAGITAIHDEKKGRYLNLLAVFHGIAAMAVPYAAAVLLDGGMTWRTVYLLASGLVLLMLVLFSVLRTPAGPASDAHPSLPAGQLHRAAFSPRMRWIYLLVFAYVASEIGIGTWMVSYLQETKAMPLPLASLYLSAFFGCLTLGRLLGSLVVDRFPPRRILAFCTAGAVLLLAAGMLGPPALAFLLPLSGLFHAVVFPTMTGMTSSLFKGNAGTVLGIQFAFAGVGGMAGSWFIGLFSDLVGSYAGFAFLLVLWAVVGLSAFRADRAAHPVSGAPSA